MSFVVFQCCRVEGEDQVIGETESAAARSVQDDEPWVPRGSVSAVWLQGRRACQQDLPTEQSLQWSSGRPLVVQGRTLSFTFVYTIAEYWIQSMPNYPKWSLLGQSQKIAIPVLNKGYRNITTWNQKTSYSYLLYITCCVSVLLHIKKINCKPKIVDNLSIKIQLTIKTGKLPSLKPH